MKIITLSISKQLYQKKETIKHTIFCLLSRSLKQCKSSGLKGIVLKDRQNVFLEREQCINFANKNGIFIHVI